MRVFLLMPFMASPLALATQAQTTTAVTFKGSDGTEFSFLFSANPILTFTDDAIILTTTSSNVELLRTVSYVATFDTSTGIQNVRNVQKENYYKIGESSIEIHSMSADLVRLYSVNGMLYDTGRCDEDGHVTFETSNLPKGIYVVKSKEINFKFQKK